MTPTSVALIQSALAVVQRVNPNAVPVEPLVRAGLSDASLARVAGIQAAKAFAEVDIRRSWQAFHPALRKVLIWIGISGIVLGGPAPVDGLAAYSDTSPSNIRKRLADARVKPFVERARSDAADGRRIAVSFGRPRSGRLRHWARRQYHLSPDRAIFEVPIGTILQKLVEDGRALVDLQRCREMVAFAAEVIPEIVIAALEMSAATEDSVSRRKIDEFVLTLKREFVERMAAPAQQEVLARELFAGQESLIRGLEADVLSMGGFVALGVVQVVVPAAEFREDE